MNTIWKYPLTIGRHQVLRMPRAARPLSAQVQDVTLTLWMQVDDSAPIVERTAHVVGTGHELPRQAMDYISTVLDPPFVWHIYLQRERDGS